VERGIVMMAKTLEEYKTPAEEEEVINFVILFII